MIRFSAGEKIMVKGEPGTWFGILLSGELRVQLPNGISVPLAEGSIIGEMAIWAKGGLRGNSVVAADYGGGIMAVMLVEDLRSLAVDHPTAGCQLMCVVGHAALAKQMDNLKRQVSTQVEPAVGWTEDESRRKAADPPDETTAELNSEAAAALGTTLS